MRYVKELNVFIASPTDVEAEREIVRGVCRQLNRDKLIQGYNIAFKDSGWEDVFPAPGRPQDIVNRLVEECDIFVCIFHRRFGSPTGKEESGTLEEFLVAYDLWESLSKPHIMFYFKEVRVSSSKDLGDPQLQKVFELKEKIVTGRKLLFKEFATADKFQDMFTENLKDWVVANFKRETEKDRPVKRPRLEIPEAYRRWLTDYCQYMDIDRMREKSDVIQVSLPEIYVPLYAQDPEAPKKKEQEAVAESVRGGQAACDIEELAAKYDTLVVAGSAGSGKTTLIKHLSYRIMEREGLKGLEGYLPVLIFLRDLKGVKEDSIQKRPGCETAFECVISHYLSKTENGLGSDCIKAFCQAGKAIFLVDGLDEIDPDSRQFFVDALSNFRNQFGPFQVVLTGRPHGIDAAVNRRFRKQQISILPFNMVQVEEFIGKWFRFVFDAKSKIGAKTAQDMTGEIKAHPGTDALIDNPLMLTAVCILYHDGKELPGQRAELYKKFISNLLSRRFKEEYGRVYAFLQKIAASTFNKGERGFDREPALLVLGEEYPKRPDETATDYKGRLIQKFEEIEPGCGLLAMQDGYVFRHLTFQEYLAATDIIRRETDYAGAIRNYWDIERYKEMIELYVGFLSIENKRWANLIVEEVLKGQDRSPYPRWRLAARALLGMHKDQRETAVLDQATEKLRLIMQSDAPAKDRADAGETLGWLEDRRDLAQFIPVAPGRYKTSQGETKVKGLEMGVFPVVNQWFRKFVEAAGYDNRDFWSMEGKKWLDYKKESHPRFWHERRWICPNAPVVGVCWYEADAFCRWLTITRDDGYTYRLPDEKEWEAAAAGLKGRKYSWGEWAEDHCNTDEAGIGKTTSVGIFPKGNTPEGISDLSGNVWEWTCADYHGGQSRSDFVFDEKMQKLYDEENWEKYWKAAQEQNRQLPVLRGGSWNSYRDGAGCSGRNRNHPDARSYFVGFRCVRTK
jgi:formylglycine-generating enzyme required for sulfatase activity/energy-coupling factor transporter ATP-binding protein EcfA2